MSQKNDHQEALHKLHTRPTYFQVTRSICALGLALAATACFPPDIGGETSETTESGSETSTFDTGDGDGDPGDGDGDPDPGCAMELPHDWAEGLADAWLHTCNVDGTRVECCAAVWTGADHLSVAYAFAGGGSYWWGTAPLFADAGELKNPYISNGKTRFGRVSWDHCGLPKNTADPTTRTFELHVVDHELGASASDSVTMGGGVIHCLDDVGEMWGPCPLTSDGSIDLCHHESLACVPADGQTAHACLPLGECPPDMPVGAFGQTGWGGVCYPRCESDNDCATGQVCAAADADGGSMCAWAS